MGHKATSHRETNGFTPTAVYHINLRFISLMTFFQQDRTILYFVVVRRSTCDLNSRSLSDFSASYFSVASFSAVATPTRPRRQGNSHRPVSAACLPCWPSVNCWETTNQTVPCS